MKRLLPLVALLVAAAAGGAAGPARATCCAVPLQDETPVWSADGTQLAYYEANGAGSGWRVLDVPTGTTRPFFAQVPAGTGSTDVVLSPDWQRAASVRLTGSDGQGALVVSRRSDGAETTLADAYDVAPAWSPDGSRIAFLQKSPLGLALATIPAAGGSPAVVVEGLPVIGSPVWSPDGTLLAYHTHSGMVVSAADGSGARVIDPSGSDVPAWSPGGEELAVLANAGTFVDVVTRDGTLVRRFPSPFGPSEIDGTVRWTPDGRTLLYSGPTQPAEFPGSGVVAIDVASGQTRVLSRFGTDPAPSPDGATVAFGGIGHDLDGTGAPHSCFGVGIWTVPFAGGTPRAVASGDCAGPHELTVPAGVAPFGRTTLEYGRVGSLSGSLLGGFETYRVSVVAQWCHGGSDVQPLVWGGPTAAVQRWDASIAPLVSTTYTVELDTRPVGAVAVAVAPSVDLLRAGRWSFAVRVFAGRELAARSALVERLAANHWVLAQVLPLRVRRTETGSVGSASFTVRYRPRGTSVTLRVVVPASDCYGAGQSATTTYLGR